MSMDATLQVRMDRQMKADAETLYRNLGTSFAEAVRIFAQQSILVGGLPFRPTLNPEDMADQVSDSTLTVGNTV